MIQIFTKQGSGTPTGEFSAEAGSFDTFRERASSSGSIGQFDYSIGASRLDTDNERPNNQYRLTSGVVNIGWSPNEQLRISSLFTYSLADTGNPNSIFDPKPIDNFLTERWLIAPHVDFKPVDWWEHKFIFSYDHERQVNDPNEDGFVGPTRALFKRATVDYQNDLKPASWLTLTSGFFYSDVDAGQERPFISQAFGPQPTFISDHTEETAAFLEASVTPFEGLLFVAGGRYDHFNQFGDVWTYRVAGSYRIKPTDTILHSSIATGFSPPSSQDKIFGNNFGLEPEKDRGFDVGIEQHLWERTRHRRRYLFSQQVVELDRFQRTLRHVESGRCTDARSGKRDSDSTAAQISRFWRLIHILMRKKLHRWTSTNRKARGCRAGRAMRFMFPLRISGARNCGRRRKRSLLTRARN